ncbi:hypothetical protein [Arthrobacter sp. Leaf234]|uniref:hypothetical protein n=1 Tax=Arthrobacter sp. Leaf234 TaxID=1736303 RepID=UPI000A842F87|nr:hypothetical protein [Arthrobacter sp. Leaf234]
MQGHHTRLAMQHAGLSLATVWEHFLNMGGCIDHLEVDGYLHGVITLPADDGDCVTQAVNELLDDQARVGLLSCCRAPYSRAGASGPAGPRTLFRACPAAGPHPAADGMAEAAPTGAAARRAPRPSSLQPVRRAVRRER